MLKFFWNGIKGADGKLRRVIYSAGELRSYPAGTISIYAKDYGPEGHFPADVRAAFAVENNSDMMTDYFETDTIRVLPTHPLYPQVLAALGKRKARSDAKTTARLAAA